MAVSQGDDAFDNRLELEIDEGWELPQIIDKILRLNYLPKISGGKATWSVAYDQPLGVIAQQWEKPKLISSRFPFSINDKYKDFDSLHFNYHAQKDPDIVYEVLSRFRTVC
jgi:hypothetical protein